MKKLLLLVAVCFTQLGFAQNILYVDSAAAGTKSGASWSNAYTDLQPALEAAQAGDEI